MLTGVSLASGTAGTIATGAAVKQATNVTALGGTLNVASTTGFSSPSGTATVATTDPGGATIAYTGTTGTSLTGVTLSSGSGFVSTGGAVSSGHLRHHQLGDRALLCPGHHADHV